LEKGSVVWTAQCGFHLLGQAYGIFNGPLWKQAGMDHEKRTLAIVEGLVPQPVNDGGPIVCGENAVNGIFGAKRDDSLRDCEQEEFVITENETD